MVEVNHKLRKEKLYRLYQSSNFFIGNLILETMKKPNAIQKKKLFNPIILQDNFSLKVKNH